MTKYRGYLNILSLVVVFVFCFFLLKTQAQCVIPGGNVSSDCLAFDSTLAVLFTWLAAGKVLQELWEVKLSFQTSPLPLQ